MAVVLDARAVEVGQVAAVVDDPLRVGVGEADPREARVLERRLAVCDAPELERHHAPERERLGKGGSFPPRAR